MRYLTVNEPSRVRLPFSEACMHMRLAGKERNVVPLPGGMAQIVNDDGDAVLVPGHVG